MTDQELQTWREAVFQATVVENPYIPAEKKPNDGKPHPKQCDFLKLVDVEEVLFGGAAGGGKSAALLMAALQFVHMPGYHAVIIGRKVVGLKQAGALIAEAHEWLRENDGGGKGKPTWDGENTYIFPSGATLSFRYIGNNTDRYSFKSTAYHYIAFEEVTEFPEEDYTYLFRSLRGLEGSTIPLRMRGATNPGGIGHSFIKRRFGLDDDGVQNEEAKKAGRIFIQAFAKDNPSLGKRYEKTLDNLTFKEREYQKFGKWSDFTGDNFQPSGWPTYKDLGGGVFTITNELGKRQFVSLENCILVASMDFAIGGTAKNDSTSFGAGAIMPDGRLMILDVTDKKLRLEENAPALDTFCQRWHPMVTVGDNDNMSLAIYNECRRFRNIPEIRRLKIGGKSKLARAHDAIVMGETNRILLPDKQPSGDELPWMVPFKSQLMSFTGADKAEDDMVDMLSLMARIAVQLRGNAYRQSDDYGVLKLTEERSTF